MSAITRIPSPLPAPFSKAVKAGGFLFLSGALPMDAQGNVLDHRHRVRQGLDARGVHGPHGLHDVEKSVDLSEHALTFIRLQFKPGQIGDPGNVVVRQGHVEGFGNGM